MISSLGILALESLDFTAAPYFPPILIQQAVQYWLIGFSSRLHICCHLHIPPGFLASVLLYFLFTTSNTSMLFQSLSSSFSHRALSILGITQLLTIFKFKLPRPYSQSCFASLFLQIHPSYQIFSLKRAPDPWPLFLPFQSCAGLNSFHFYLA